MKTFFVFLSLLLLSSSLQAEELVRAVSFSNAFESGALRAGEMIDEDTLTVKAAPGKQFQHLIELSDPGISLDCQCVLDRLMEKIKVLDSQEIVSEFERTLRSRYAEGKLDMETLKALLVAHQEDLEYQPNSKRRRYP